MSVNEIQLANRFIKLAPDSRRNFLNKLQLHELDFLELPIVETRHLYADTIPLSYAQRSLWLTWQLNPESSAYNMSGILKIKGKLDKKALQQGINALVKRHETLRTLFVLTEAGEPIQQIKQDVNISLAEYDLTQDLLSSDKALDLSNEFASQAFQLDQEPPFRASLLCLPDDSYHFLVSIHHIAADGWSLQIFIDELIALYTEAVTGTSAALAELPIQFADFSIWQRSWLDAGEMDKQLDYWCQHLGHEHTELNLPFDHSRAANTSMPAAGHSFLLTDNVATALKTLATQQQSSLYMVMLSLLKLTLYRLTGETDLRIGSPIANRTRAETHGLIGYLTNVQVLRTQLDVTVGFAELLTQVRTTVLGGQSNPDVPFDMLVETLKPERQPGIHPLFQVKCTQQTHDDNSGEYQFAGLAMQIEALGVEEAHFDLSFDFTDEGSEIAAAFNYNSALFEPETIARFADLFVSFAEQVLVTPNKALALLTVDNHQSEKQGVALKFSDDNILDLWNKSVASKAEQIAVQDQDHNLTFKALDNKANQLASQLQQQGIKNGTCVAILAERSCEFVLAILAVLKSGGMYLPLDPQQPKQRLLYQLKDSQAAAVLTVTDLDWLAEIPAIAQVKLDIKLGSGENLAEQVVFLAEPIHPAQAAYMIYTSGTTGQPKGVVISHHALNNYTQSILTELALPETIKSMAMVSTVAADLGNTTLFGALCSGRTLHLISADLAFDPDAFAQYMATHQIEVLKIVPSHLQGLLSAAEPENVLPKQLLIVGGEATSQSLLSQINQLAPELEVLNHYGPTESTVGVLTHKLISSGNIVDLITLGLPIANTKVCILGADLQAVPTGVVGELFIGGAALAQGYLAQTGQTAERFIADPEGSGARLYRTGDKVKQHSDGTFEFIGRVDEQVKIRGYRVELNEVKQHLLNIEDISDAAVIVKEQDGRAQLYAYLVPASDNNLDIAAIRQTLATQLPDYMVPTRLTELAAFPLNANGKLDKKALLDNNLGLESQQTENAEGQVAKGPEEQVLADIWQQVLSVEQVNRHDNFFALGGDSIQALKVVARARKQGLKFKPKALLENPTISTLVAVLNEPKGEVENKLAAIWCEVLGVAEISRSDNFFALGGDSIQALKVVARARKQALKFKPKQLIEASSLATLAAVIPVVVDSETANAVALGDESEADITPLANEQRDNIPLSFAQARQWFLWQLTPESTAYHIAGALNLTGELNVNAFKASFNGLVARHESLRTMFSDNGDGSAHQVIQDELLLDMPVIDLSALEGNEQAEAAKSQALAWHATPFDLTKGPLLRIGLIQLAADKHVLVVVMHHIISDGWSMQVLVNEFVARYQAEVEGTTLNLPELPIQYVDYAVWQRNWLEAGELEKQLTYWREHLGDEQPVLQLPTDNVRKLEADYTEANHGFILSAELSKGLKKVAGQYQSTLFMTLLTAYQTLLYRYTGQEDIRIGVPIANRHRSEVENVIGFFVNTQVLRGVVHGRMPLSEVLQQAKTTALGAQEHQDLPFEKLVEALQPERSLSHTPLFQVMYNHQRSDDTALSQMPGLSIEGYELGGKGAQFELTLDTTENSEGEISVNFSYAKELFNADTIECLSGYYLAILTALVEMPAQAIGDIELLSEIETKQLTQWAVNNTRYDNTQPVHQLIEQQVGLTPNATALVFEDEQLTYSELNQRANQLAHYLIAQGVKPEDKVGIAVERTIDMVVSLLAVLKAGGAFVPLDPNYPQERLAYMIADSGLTVLLSQRETAQQFSGIQGVAVAYVDTLSLDDELNTDPDITLNKHNLAYLIYTSGSTGKPKAVAISHSSFAEHVQVSCEFFSLTANDRMLQFSTINFDGFIEQMFPPLTLGASIFLRGSELWDAETFYRQLIDKKITVTDLPTAYGAMLIQYFAEQGTRDYGQLREIHFGGEAMSPESISVWKKANLENVTLLNTYGPTEAVVTASISDCADYISGERALPQQMPIGSPLAGRDLYVLDAGLTQVPTGVAGELCIGGDLLARGYLGGQALTAQSFIANPFSEEGGRLYRTGDLVRWNNNGELEYLGRIDHQVKIRGFRIELGEIESALLKQKDVSEAVVVAKASQSGTRLVAYVTASADVVIDTNELKAVLGKSLPDYMVPSIIVLLDALPLNPNGKIDRKALPEPEFVSNNEYAAPVGEVETQLAQIWCEVLGLEQVGRNDNFFELGGHSLLAVSLINRVNKAFSISLSVRVMFENSVFVNFAQLVSSLMETSITNDKLEGLDTLMASLETL